MAEYLRSYAARFALPVRLRWRVDELSRDFDGYLVSSVGRSLRADTVVVATGPAMRPRVPDVADQLDPGIRSLHSVDYRNPGQLRNGSVLIVGAGNSGAEIALDLAATHEVILAGRDTGRIPISLGGPTYWVMNQLLTTNTRLGWRFAASVHAGKGTPLVRVRPADLVEAGVERAPRVVGQVDGRPRLEDRRALDVANVIWCTGYRPDYSWIALPHLPPATSNPLTSGAPCSITPVCMSSDSRSCSEWPRHWSAVSARTPGTSPTSSHGTSKKPTAAATNDETRGLVSDQPETLSVRFSLRPAEE